MAKDRARDIRRSVGSHEKMMGALGRAAGWKRYPQVDTGEKEVRPEIAIHEKGTWSEGPKKQFIPGQGNISSNEFLPSNLEGEQGLIKKDFKA